MNEECVFGTKTYVKRILDTPIPFLGRVIQNYKPIILFVQMLVECLERRASPAFLHHLEPVLRFVDLENDVLVTTVLLQFHPNIEAVLRDVDSELLTLASHCY